jgi:hypothetical protein
MVASDVTAPERHDVQAAICATGMVGGKIAMQMSSKANSERQPNSLPFFNMLIAIILAEGVRFELTVGFRPTTVFKTVALNHSATLPVLIFRRFLL